MSTCPRRPTRTIHCDDAIQWLTSHTPLPGSSLVTSLPDISEFRGRSLQDWSNWFIQTAALILQKTPDDGVAVFYQSDIKTDGIWVDKGFLCQKAAEVTGHRLLWHKIGCRAPAGTVTHGRCGYSHILCFSRCTTIPQEPVTPDVLPTVGEKSWQRGMGRDAALFIATFIAQQAKSRLIINPFCGQGMLLAAANEVGLNCIGIERSPKRAEISDKATL